MPQPERWRHPPFSGAIVEGSIWGRGALDDKSSLIAIMEAAESLVAAGHMPERSVIFVFGHDEESGGAGARAAAELLASRKIKAAFVLDEGGLSLQRRSRDECAPDAHRHRREGLPELQLEVKVAGGHSNAPGEHTAVDTLARALVAIRANSFAPSYAGVTRDMLEAMAPHAPPVTRMAIANSWLFEPLLRSRTQRDTAGRRDVADDDRADDAARLAEAERAAVDRDSDDQSANHAGRKHRQRHRARAGVDRRSPGDRVFRRHALASPRRSQARNREAIASSPGSHRRCSMRRWRRC